MAEVIKNNPFGRGKDIIPDFHEALYEDDYGALKEIMDNPLYAKKGEGEYIYRGPVMPNFSGVDRRFLSRSQLPDGSWQLDDATGNGRPAPLGLPVSSFNGVDGMIGIPEFNFTVGKFIELYIDLSAVVSTEYFFGHNLTQGIRYDGSSLLIFTSNPVANKAIPYITPSGLVKLKFDRITLSDFEVFSDDVSIGIISNAAFNELDINLIGKRNDGFYFGGNMHSVNFNNELYIPLPHLGYGFDQNGDEVALTVSDTGVSLGLDPKGSTHLLDKGLVERNPELINEFNNGTVYPYEIFESSGTEILSAENSSSFGGCATNELGDLKLGDKLILEITNFDLLSGVSPSDCYIANTPTGAASNLSGFIDINSNGVYEMTIHTISSTGKYYFQIGYGNGEFGRFSLIASLKKVTPNIRPNNNEGQPISQLGEWDTLVQGNPKFVNRSDWLADMGDDPTATELVVNGDFSQGATGWTLSGGSTISPGFATIFTNDGSLSLISQTNVQIGGYYVLSYDIVRNSAGSLQFQTNIDIPSNVGSHKILILSQTEYSSIKRKGGVTNVDIDITNISVKQAHPSIAYFFKSRTDIYKQAVRDDVWYNADRPDRFHSSELQQPWWYENIETVFKYQMWARWDRDSTVGKDFFFYGTALAGPEICQAKRYVDKGEVLTETNPTHYVCPLDEVEY